MKRLLLIISIALAFVSCDNPDMENDEDRVTVTFETFGGTEIAPLRVRIGTPIGQVIPKKDPAKAEHEFEGWFTTEDFGKSSLKSTRVYELTETPIEQDITLYAKLVWYYPFEVSNITHEWVEDVNGIREDTITFYWTNPVDENFSHVIVKWNEANPGDNSIRINYIGFDNITFICVDIHGNYSRGVEYQGAKLY